MKLLHSRRYALALIALAAVASVGCCCTRKGLVLRGDWSLELNRVPHMRSNGPTYDADCAAPSCTSCTSGSCTCGDALSAAGGQEFGAVDGGGSRCLVQRGRMVGGAGGEYFDEGHGGAYGDAYAGGENGENYVQHDPAAPAFSRFHPVPTRPVFEPQPVAYHPAMGAPPQPQVERLPPLDGASKRRTSTSPSTVRRPTSSVGSAPTAQQSQRYVLVELEQPAGEVRQVSHAEAVEEAPASEEATPDVESATTAKNLAIPATGKNTVTWKVARRRA
ncbi:MAG: hypothetical protein C0483_23495 [Pirellula sp.]|nr:hypothetical protein [Pirellula sp.]